METGSPQGSYGRSPGEGQRWLRAGWRWASGSLQEAEPKELLRDWMWGEKKGEECQGQCRAFSELWKMKGVL